MPRPKQMGHAEGLPWRRRAAAALEQIVEDAPPDLREAVRHEVAWEARRWFEVATDGATNDPQTRDTLEMARPTPALVAVRMCGGHCGLPLPSSHVARVSTADGPADLCHACYAERFPPSKGNGVP